MKKILLTLIFTTNCYAADFYSLSTDLSCESDFKNQSLNCNEPLKWDKNYGVSVSEKTWCMKDEQTGDCVDNPVLNKNENIISLIKDGFEGSKIIHLMLKTNRFIITEVSYWQGKSSTNITEGRIHKY